MAAAVCEHLHTAGLATEDVQMQHVDGMEDDSAGSTLHAWPLLASAPFAGWTDEASGQQQWLAEGALGFGAAGTSTDWLPRTGGSAVSAGQAAVSQIQQAQSAPGGSAGISPPSSHMQAEPAVVDVTDDDSDSQLGCAAGMAAEAGGSQLWDAQGVPSCGAGGHLRRLSAMEWRPRLSC